MPKHAFKFPAAVSQAVRRHVERAVQSVDAARFHQEPSYTTSLLTRLEGIAYQGEHGVVKFTPAVLPDRGAKSAESRFGADFAITATISDSRIRIEKAILVQAKLGYVEDLDRQGLESLKLQIRKMRQIVKSPKVMEIITNELFRDPRVVSGTRILAGQPFRSSRLSEYFVGRVLTTLDGSTDPEAVDAIKRGDWDKLDVLASLEGD
jgi:hypothetical protein